MINSLHNARHFANDRQFGFGELLGVWKPDVLHFAKPHAVEKQRVQAAKEQKTFGDAALHDLAQAGHQVAENSPEYVEFR